MVHCLVPPPPNDSDYTFVILSLPVFHSTAFLLIPFHFFLYVSFTLLIIFLYFLIVPINFNLNLFSLEYFKALLHLLFTRA